VDERQLGGDRRRGVGAALCAAADARGVDAQRRLASFVEQRGDLDPARFVDGERDAGRVALGSVEAALSSGPSRGFEDF
jgi:hypothetical protein